MTWKKVRLYRDSEKLLAATIPAVWMPFGWPPQFWYYPSVDLSFGEASNDPRYG